MDQRHTRRALDELADLYLTHPEAAAERAAAGDGQGAAYESTAPVGAIRPDEPAGREEAGSSDRRGGAPASGPRADQQGASEDHPEQAETEGIEAVLLGHLPGYAGPWLTQYAHEVAERWNTGVGLARIEGGGVDLELVEVEPPGPLPHTGGPDTLEREVHQLGGRVGRWLVLADPSDDSALAERLARAPRWTLLTGADDAAVVGAYRLLKRLTTATGGAGPAEGVGLMFLGCNQQAAEDAAERLTRTAAALLRAPLRWQGVRQRMAPARRQRVGRFEMGTNAQAWDRLMATLRREAMEEETPASAADLLTAEELAALHEPDSVDEPAGPAEVHSGDPPPPSPASEPDEAIAPDPPESAAEEAAPRMHVSASPDEVAIPADGEAGRIDKTDTPVEGPLSAYLPELRPVDVRCPHRPRVELAVGSDGRLHLLRFAGQRALDAAVRDLMETGGWARTHHELLSRCAEQRLDPAAPPQLHLFSDEPRPALPIAYHASEEHRPIRVHLLKPVTVGGEQTYVHHALS